MPKVTAIVADDDKLSLEHTKSKLDENWPDIVISGTASNGIEALKLIGNLQPDIAFLSIKMSGMSGIEVAQKVLHTCKVVFITVFDQYIVKVLENEAIDHIITPISSKRLLKTVERIKIHLEQNYIQSNLPLIYEKIQSNMTGRMVTPKYLTSIKLIVKGSERVVPVNQIYYFQSNKKHTNVITENLEVLISKPISKLADELDPDKFFQIHKTTIVNTKFIENVTSSPSNRGLLKIKGRPEILTVSRKFSSIFERL